MHMSLTFEHLYDDRWGHIQKARYKWENPTIIFPSDFTPEIGKKYACRIMQTNATFVYNGVTYNVLSAYLENCAAMADEIAYDFRERPPKKTAMELAFENAGKE